MAAEFARIRVAPQRPAWLRLGASYKGVTSSPPSICYYRIGLPRGDHMRFNADLYFGRACQGPAWSVEAPVRVRVSLLSGADQALVSYECEFAPMTAGDSARPIDSAFICEPHAAGDIRCSNNSGKRVPMRFASILQGNTLLLVAVALGCLCELGRAEEGAADSLKSVMISDVPHVHQRPDFCGEACTEMYLSKLGKKMDQDFVFDQSGLDPLEGRGCYTRELSTALRRIGFDTGAVWHTVSARDPAPQLNALFRSVHNDLSNGVPSILCMHYDERPNSTEHFRLVLGYDAKKKEIIFHEPAEADGSHKRMKLSKLMSLWPLKYDSSEWTVIRFRLQPGRLISGQSSSALTNADFAQHILALKGKLGNLKNRQISLKKQREKQIETYNEQERKRVLKARAVAEKRRLEAIEKGETPPPSRPIRFRPTKLKPRVVSDFQIVIQEPFVVVGDESLSQVSAHARGTIAWAVSRIKQDYFQKDPDHVITIWLFAGKTSYEQNVYDIFDSRPHTPFGYYSRTERALVMNIATGGGTLVHEIVHPFMAENFPKCPSWFNEGLASLYEQCADQNGHIWGQVNWRLRGLRESLKDEDYEMPSFEELCGTSTYEFYRSDPGTNYSQARYLCYYLQQKGLLVKYFHEFKRSVKDDPTGFKTLQRMVDEEDMEVFQEKWEKWVLEL